MRFRKIGYVFLASVILLLITSGVVLATTVNIQNLLAIPKDTTMSLTWTKSSYTDTIIRYRTDTYPTSWTDGSSVYTGVAISYKQTGLTAGTTYYYSAWGWDGGSNYSVTVDNTVMTTLSASSIGDNLPQPTISTPVAPSSGGWLAGLQPFSGFVQGFEVSWGMNTDTMPYTLGIIGLLVVGFGVYIKTKSPFVAIIADFILDFGLIAMGLLNTWTVGVVIAFGLGVWALDNIWI